MALDPATIDTMKRIKQTLDPNNILNPGKIFV
jgi:FAD/FMN-containing dehydrogenase